VSFWDRSSGAESPSFGQSIVQKLGASLLIPGSMTRVIPTPTITISQHRFGGAKEARPDVDH
jgi:hypothetical protein